MNIGAGSKTIKKVSFIFLMRHDISHEEEQSVPLLCFDYTCAFAGFEMLEVGPPDSHVRQGLWARTIFIIIWLVQLPKIFQTSLSYFNLVFITVSTKILYESFLFIYLFTIYKSLSIHFYLNLHKYKYYNHNLPCRSGHQQLVHKVWESASIFLPAASRWRCSSAQEL